MTTLVAAGAFGVWAIVCKYIALLFEHDDARRGQYLPFFGHVPFLLTFVARSWWWSVSTAKSQQVVSAKLIECSEQR